MKDNDKKDICLEKDYHKHIKIKEYIEIKKKIKKKIKAKIK
jgi:hypothetical protein